MGDFIGRNFKKQSARAKEKLLESLGKADRTTDEAFDEQYANFVRQQAAADKLAKNMRTYVASVKAMCAASRALHDVVREVYEPQWPNKEHVTAMTQSLDLLWDDYAEKLQDQVMNPVSSYSTQFSETKLRIDKRGRKLLDYDSARHNVLQTQQNKKADDSKATKAQEQLAAAQSMYVTLNTELLQEMPAIYERRMKLYAHTFHSCYSLSATLHRESGKIEADLAQYVEELNLAADQYRAVQPHTPSSVSSAGDHNSHHRHSLERPKEAPPAAPPTKPTQQNGSSSPQQQPEEDNPFTAAPGDVKQTRSSSNDSRGDVSPFPEESSTSEQPTPTTPDKQQPQASSAATYPRLSGVEPDESAAVNGTEAEKKPDESAGKQASTLPNTSETSPAAAGGDAKQRALYKVRATHKYTAEDTDELSFEAGELIKVVPYDDPEEQDEGWQMGILESTGAKGVFPENFTKPI